jgi:hypothetical protein
LSKFAKPEAPPVSLERPLPVLRAPSAGQSGQPQADSLPQIDNALVAELESALQAVVARGPWPQAADEAKDQAAATVNDEDEASEDARPASDADWGEAGPPPFLLLRPAEAAEPLSAPALELDAAMSERRPSAAAPRRRRLPLRAALCAGGVLALAGAGGAGLMLAGSADDRFAAPLPKPVKTETIQASSAPAAIEAEPTPGERQAEAGSQPEADAPAGVAAAEMPAGEVTLLRPVGARSDAAAAAPAERAASPDRQQAEGAVSPDRELADTAGTIDPVKAPDRLVEAPAPAPPAPTVEAPAPEAPPALFGTGEEASGFGTISPVAEPAASDERLPGLASTVRDVMAKPVPAPLAEEELVARTAPQGRNADSGAAMPGGADAAQAEQDAALAPVGEDGLGLAAPATGEPTRSATVTSAVNLRAGPDNGAGVLGVVPAGSEVGLIGCEYWCEIVFQGERGWVYRSFLSGADS